MECRKLYGVVCASITPMRPDGTVDMTGVRKLTRHLVERGIHCLYPNGTNGESLSLTQAERKAVAQAILEENNDRAVLYVQCGAATVAESYAQLRFARQIGAHGAGLMTPVFFPVDREGMRRYFEDILPEVADLPVYAYNIPSRTGNDLDAGLLGELMDRHDNLFGVKYSSADLQRFEQYLHATQKRRPSVLVGCDALAAYTRFIGGDGWVSGPSAVFARRHTGLYDAVEAKDHRKAGAIQFRIADTARRMGDIPEIPAIKYMLKRLGVIDCDACRAPLRPLNEAEKARLDVLLEESLQEDQMA